MARSYEEAVSILTKRREREAADEARREQEAADQQKLEDLRAQGIVGDGTPGNPFRHEGTPLIGSEEWQQAEEERGGSGSGRLPKYERERRERERQRSGGGTSADAPRPTDPATGTSAVQQEFDDPRDPTKYNFYNYRNLETGEHNVDNRHVIVSEDSGGHRHIRVYGLTDAGEPDFSSTGLLATEVYDPEGHRTKFEFHNSENLGYIEDEEEQHAATEYWEKQLALAYQNWQLAESGQKGRYLQQVHQAQRALIAIHDPTGQGLEESDYDRQQRVLGQLYNENYAGSRGKSWDELSPQEKDTFRVLNAFADQGKFTGQLSYARPGYGQPGLGTYDALIEQYQDHPQVQEIDALARDLQHRLHYVVGSTDLDTRKEIHEDRVRLMGLINDLPRNMQEQFLHNVSFIMRPDHEWMRYNYQRGYTGPDQVIREASSQAFLQEGLRLPRTWDELSADINRDRGAYENYRQAAFADGHINDFERGLLTKLGTDLANTWETRLKWYPPAVQDELQAQVILPLRRQELEDVGAIEVWEANNERLRQAFEQESLQRDEVFAQAQSDLQADSNELLGMIRAARQDGVITVEERNTFMDRANELDQKWTQFGHLNPITLNDGRGPQFAATAEESWQAYLNQPESALELLDQETWGGTLRPAPTAVSRGGYLPDPDEFDPGYQDELARRAQLARLAQLAPYDEDVNYATVTHLIDPMRRYEASQPAQQPYYLEDPTDPASGFGIQYSGAQIRAAEIQRMIQGIDADNRVNTLERRYADLTGGLEGFTTGLPPAEWQSEQAVSMRAAADQRLQEAIANYDEVTQRISAERTGDRTRGGNILDEPEVKEAQKLVDNANNAKAWAYTATNWQSPEGRSYADELKAWGELGPTERLVAMHQGTANITGGGALSAKAWDYEIPWAGSAASFSGHWLPAYSSVIATPSYLGPVGRTEDERRDSQVDIALATIFTPATAVAFVRGGPLAAKGLGRLSQWAAHSFKSQAPRRLFTDPRFGDAALQRYISRHFADPYYQQGALRPVVRDAAFIGAEGTAEGLLEGAVTASVGRPFRPDFISEYKQELAFYPLEAVARVPGAPSVERVGDGQTAESAADIYEQLNLYPVKSSGFVEPNPALPITERLNLERAMGIESDVSTNEELLYITSLPGGPAFIEAETPEEKRALSAGLVEEYQQNEEARRNMDSILIQMLDYQEGAVAAGDMATANVYRDLIDGQDGVRQIRAQLQQDQAYLEKHLRPLDGAVMAQRVDSDPERWIHELTAVNRAVDAQLNEFDTRLAAIDQAQASGNHQQLMAAYQAQMDAFAEYDRLTREQERLSELLQPYFPRGFAPVAGGAGPAVLDRPSLEFPPPAPGPIIDPARFVPTGSVLPPQRMQDASIFQQAMANIRANEERKAQQAKDSRQAGQALDALRDTQQSAGAARSRGAANLAHIQRLEQEIAEGEMAKKRAEQAAAGAAPLAGAPDLFPDAGTTIAPAQAPASPTTGLPDLPVAPQLEEDEEDIQQEGMDTPPIGTATPEQPETSVDIDTGLTTYVDRATGQRVTVLPNGQLVTGSNVSIHPVHRLLTWVNPATNTEMVLTPQNQVVPLNQLARQQQIAIQPQLQPQLQAQAQLQTQSQPRLQGLAQLRTLPQPQVQPLPLPELLTQTQLQQRTQLTPAQLAQILANPQTLPQHQVSPLITPWGLPAHQVVGITQPTAVLQPQLGGHSEIIPETTTSAELTPELTPEQRRRRRRRRLRLPDLNMDASGRKVLPHASTNEAAKEIFWYELEGNLFDLHSREHTEFPVPQTALDTARIVSTTDRPARGSHQAGQLLINPRNNEVVVSPNSIRNRIRRKGASNRRYRDEEDENHRMQEIVLRIA